MPRSTAHYTQDFFNTVKNIYTLSNTQYRYSAIAASNIRYSEKFGTRFSPIWCVNSDTVSSATNNY